MEAYPPPTKKSRPEVFSNGSFQGTDGGSFKLNNGFAQEWESFPTNVGSKSKACLKYFSTSGCPYGEGCHFSHYVPGGIASLGPLQPSGMAGSGGATAGLRKGHTGSLMPIVLHRERGTAPLGFKTRLCNRFESPDGCSFGAKCNFAHGEQELRKASAHGDVASKPYVSGAHEAALRTHHSEPTPPGLAISAAASFGAMSTAKVSINSSLAGIIIGKGGINAKAISRSTGARIFIRDHESDVSLKNVEMEGSLDQIKLASAMVRELLADKDILPGKPGGLGTHSYKSKLCANFVKGSCTYGDRCHFAHGEGEMRQLAGSPL